MMRRRCSAPAAIFTASDSTLVTFHEIAWPDHVTRRRSGGREKGIFVFTSNVSTF